MPEVPSVVDELRVLKERVLRLHGPVGAHVATPRDPTGTSTPTTPNAKGELPLGEVCHLASRSFPESRKKAKGDYNPSQTICRTDGPLLKRLGSRGLTVKHFRESMDLDTLEDRSSSVNFSSDFSPSAVLPSASSQYSSYEDTLNIIDDLGTMDQEVIRPHAQIYVALAGIRGQEQVAGPREHAIASPPDSALHEQADYPLWWSGFCESLSVIDHQSTVLTQEADVGKDKRQVNGRRDQEERREKSRRSAIPYSICRLTPPLTPRRKAFFPEHC
ncbi:hypothetical protein PHMEG_0005495 [Phytophthora megakarya]|uniref:Uncharacterized protein n=1 Tax=Phytophthora megakarya TaxID=4795 RepID=A0A225WR56_9STRA|nr:hypothetical protein PHMEG_0005495 [Phytophthora megakarya]